MNEREEFRMNSRLWVWERKNCLGCVGDTLILGTLVFKVLGRHEWSSPVAVGFTGVLLRKERV